MRYDDDDDIVVYLKNFDFLKRVKNFLQIMGKPYWMKTLFKSKRRALVSVIYGLGSVNEHTDDLNKKIRTMYGEHAFISPSTTIVLGDKVKESAVVTYYDV